MGKHRRPPLPSSRWSWLVGWLAGCWCLWEQDLSSSRKAALPLMRKWNKHYAVSHLSLQIMHWVPFFSFKRFWFLCQFLCMLIDLLDILDIFKKTAFLCSKKSDSNCPTLGPLRSFQTIFYASSAAAPRFWSLGEGAASRAYLTYNLSLRSLTSLFVVLSDGQTVFVDCYYVHSLLGIGHTKQFDFPSSFFSL